MRAFLAIFLVLCIVVSNFQAILATTAPMRGAAKIESNMQVEEVEDEESEDEEVIAPPPSQQTEDVPPSTLHERLLHFFMTHPLEDLGFLVVLVFAWNYFRGKNYNRKLVQAWLNQNKALFTENFASVPPSWVIDDESNNVFRVAASGRINCEGVVITFRLLKRQDLFGLLYGFITGARDTVTIEVLVPPDTMDPFVLGVASRADWKQLKNDHSDLKDQTSQVEIQGLPNNIQAMADNAEVVKALLPQEVCKVISDARQSFVSLHFTDNNTVSKHKQVLRFVYALPNHNNMQQLDSLMRMVMIFIDKVATFKLSEKAKSKAEKLRRLVMQQQLKETEKDRQEAAKERKLERQRKERQEMEENIKKLTGAEKQRAIERLEAKKQKELQRSREKAQRSKIIRIGS